MFLFSKKTCHYNGIVGSTALDLRFLKQILSVDMYVNNLQVNRRQAIPNGFKVVFHRRPHTTQTRFGQITAAKTDGDGESVGRTRSATLDRWIVLRSYENGVIDWRKCEPRRRPLNWGKGPRGSAAFVPETERRIYLIGRRPVE